METQFIAIARDTPGGWGHFHRLVWTLFAARHQRWTMRTAFAVRAAFTKDKTVRPPDFTEEKSSFSDVLAAGAGEVVVIVIHMAVSNALPEALAQTSKTFDNSVGEDTLHVKSFP